MASTQDTLLHSFYYAQYNRNVYMLKGLEASQAYPLSLYASSGLVRSFLAS
jgi:hypothetical protein